MIRKYALRLIAVVAEFALAAACLGGAASLKDSGARLTLVTVAMAVACSAWHDWRVADDDMRANRE